MNMPPRWGFSSFGIAGYNHVAPPELRNGSSVAARTAALIQRQCTLRLSPWRGNRLWPRWKKSWISECRAAHETFSLSSGERAGVRASVLRNRIIPAKQGRGTSVQRAARV